MTDSHQKMYKPSELHAFLKEKGLWAKKGMSQNFLIDGNILDKIVQAADIQPGDEVIEIGPGPGALTQALLQAGATVLAIEMDPLFAQELHRLQTSDHRLTIICQDVLKFPLSEKIQGKRVKIVSNLPYHITTPVLTLLLPLHECVISVTVMVQKEFANRMVGKPKTPDYSSFTLFLQFYAQVKEMFTVSPGCFYPRPKVDSAVVHCLLYPSRSGVQPEPFFAITRTAFNQRRKMMRSSLKELYSADLIERSLAALHLPITARPEELSLENFFAFYFLVREG